MTCTKNKEVSMFDAKNSLEIPCPHDDCDGIMQVMLTGTCGNAVDYNGSCDTCGYSPDTITFLEG